jgi:hypothetical protein
MILWPSAKALQAAGDALREAERSVSVRFAA